MFNTNRLYRAFGKYVAKNKSNKNVEDVTYVLRIRKKETITGNNSSHAIRSLHGGPFNAKVFPANRYS